jgi:hypothetical protein
MLQAVSTWEEIESTLTENKAHAVQEIGLLSIGGKNIFCATGHCWIGNTSFTLGPRFSLRPPTGLDHGEVTLSRIHFCFMYKCHDFEKL